MDNEDTSSLPIKKINLPLPKEDLQLSEDFGDATSLWNIRKWLQEAIEAKGAIQTGASVGCGVADIDFRLDGHKYTVIIRPIEV